MCSGRWAVGSRRLPITRNIDLRDLLLTANSSLLTDSDFHIANILCANCIQKLRSLVVTKTWIVRLDHQKEPVARG